jgi:hypothetical protein
LLAQGADPRKANGKRQTPLGLAEQRGTPAIAALLREAARAAE